MDPVTSVVALVVPTVAAVAVIMTFAFTSPPGLAAKGANIEIRNYAFSPASLRVKAGTTIRVTNADPTSHTVTANDHSFATGTLAAGAHATIVVLAPGIFRYHCNFHSFMVGVIQVAARSLPTQGGKR